MEPATSQFHNRIGLAFDFDETLAPSTYPIVLNHFGFEPDKFVSERVNPLIDEHAWETPLARNFALVSALSEDGRKLNESDLAAIGREYPLYDGVPELFERVRERARQCVDGIEVRFYMITAGFAEIPENTPIAKHFDAIYGGAHHFDDDGDLQTAKRIISHHEKTRYLLTIAKGLDLDNANPSNVFRPVDRAEWLMPVDQMIFLGDGASDMPAFKFMREHGGIAIGVHAADSAENWSHRDKTFSERRVENLAPNSYAMGSELLESVMLAVDCVCRKVALRRLGRGE